MPSSKKILQILISPYIGGVEIYTLELDKRLATSGVTIYFLSNLKSLLDKLQHCSVKVLQIWGKKVGGVKRALLVILLQPLYSLYYLPLLCYYRFYKNVRNVHLQDVGEKFILSPLCKLLGFRVIWTEHGILSSWLKNRLVLKYFRIISHFADNIIAVSQLTRDDLVQTLKINPNKVKVIYNGVDLSKIKQQENHDQSKIVISYIGRMSSDKKIDDFVKEIPLNLTGLEFHFIGDGDLLTSLQEKFASKKHLKFWGFQEDKKRFLQQMDIFIHPSLHPGEGTSLGIIEAMAYGKPVVAFDTGSFKELIQSGVNGYLIPNGDYQEFLDRILSLAKDKDLRLKMGGKGYQITKEKFDLAKNAQQFISELL